MAAKYKNKRRAFRFVISPKFQLKYSIYYLGIALTSLTILNAVIVYFLVNLINYGSDADAGIGIGQIFIRTITENRGLVVAGFMVLGFFYFLLAMVMTKNIVGPIRILGNHIEALKQGNYLHKTTLRKSDELKSLMNGLNELSDMLNNRYGTVAPPSSPQEETPPKASSDW